ncbi:SDR family NAD(P)-dependent oxidoreductase [Coxiella-like endosymbiont]|uniref:SDR family NAD(P)-dependent oxidoreductase n=1 Tax=Coxiella-like endosymbiont TaxID=1592897 RepID=UPI0034E19CA6
MIQLHLSGKRALVCDTPKGIGKACAEALAKLGCEVVVLARNENALKAVISFSSEKIRSASFLLMRKSF